MSTKTQAMQVVSALQRIRDVGPEEPEVGICYNLQNCYLPAPSSAYEESAHDLWHEHRVLAISSWDDPMNSGSSAYPIKGKYGGGYTVMWGYGPVADARWRLLDHLIEYFTSIAEEAE